MSNRRQSIVRSVSEFTGPDPYDYSILSGPQHIYDGERCIWCNINIYDSALYGPENCYQRDEPFNYTSESL